MKHKPVWREYTEALIIAFFLAMFIRGFIVEAYQIPSGSMLNTLLIGDRLLVNKFSYNVRVPFTKNVLFQTWDPQHGDVVVFAYPEDESVDYIKRIIGIPGDVLEMRDKVVYRNNVKLDEPYVRYRDNAYIDARRDNFPPIKVPEGKYFMLGDNRDDSKDSRYWGFVTREALRGKAWRIYWSSGSNPGDAGSSGFPDTEIRWKRIGRLVE